MAVIEKEVGMGVTRTLRRISSNNERTRVYKGSRSFLEKSGGIEGGGRREGEGSRGVKSPMGRYNTDYCVIN